MKKLLLYILLFFGSLNVCAQVTFTKFKFSKDSPFGMAPTRKMTDMKCTINSQKEIKKILVRYIAVDQVNDAVACTLSQKKKFQVLLTGPFQPNNSYSRWASATMWYPHKVTAFPYKIIIDYMDETSETIDINKDNISKYFPKVAWINVNFNGIDLKDDSAPVVQETLEPEDNKHPSFDGYRITPDSICLYPENASEIISFVFQSSHKPSTLFNNAKQWVAKSFSEYKDVVKMEDKDNYTLIFKGNIKQRSYKALFKSTPIRYTPILMFTATIECKEGKYRIKMEDIKIKETSTFLNRPTVTELSFKAIQTLIESEKTTADYKKFLICCKDDSKESIAFLFNSLSSAMDYVDDF